MVCGPSRKAGVRFSLMCTLSLEQVGTSLSCALCVCAFALLTSWLQAEKQAEKEASSWWSHLQEEIREGKFNTYARVGGVINFVLIVFLSWTFFISLFPHSSLCLLVGVLVGFVELPFCCWCIPQCKTLSEILAPLKVYWIRGCGYIALAALLAVASGGSVLMLFFTVLLLLDGLCYVLAHFKGESEGQEGGYDSLERGQGPSSTASATAPAPAAGKILSVPPSSAANASALQYLRCPSTRT